MSEITIIVGTPGAGKTLYTMSELRKEFEQPIEIEGKEIKRQVYYHNIPGVTIDEWKHLDDPHTWHTLPPGSVIIVDEAHEVFPKMDHKQAEPEHIKRAADLRHRGHTLVLITQHPVDVHIFLRRRCTRFLYIKRPLTQGNWADVFQFAEYQEKYKEEYFQKKADNFKFNYPTEAFGTYKSSQLHTKKSYIPKAAKRSLYAAAFALIVLIVAGFYVVASFKDRATPIDPTISVTNDGLVKSVGDRIVDTVNDYLQQHEPRVVGLPHTAPLYDSVTEPKTFPRYNCISNANKCHCYTQQATRIDTTDEICRQIIDRGYFDNTRQEST